MHLSEIWHSKKNDCRLSRTQVIILVDYLKVADTFSLDTSSEYARLYEAVAEKSLELYHINFWSYIVLLHFA